MYTLVKALVKPKGRQGRWLEQNLSGTIVSQIYLNYTQCFLILTNSLNPTKQVSLDMETQRLEFSAFGGTVNEWLASLGNRSLPTADSIPEISIKLARYEDAYRANYSVRLVHPTAHPDAELPKSEFTDLIIQRSETDYRLLQDNCLFSVNGLWHLSEYSSEGVRIPKGGISSRIANRTELGILSFLNVAPIQQIAITKAMLYKQRPEQKHYNTAYIKVPVDTNNKTVLLVIGGYLHVLDNCYRNVGDNLFAIDFNNLDLVERIIQSKQLMDIESLGLTKYESNGDLIDLQEVYSDEFIEKYLTLPQSFIVVVDTPSLFVERHYLSQTGLPGRYIAHRHPRLPVMGYNGIHYPTWWVNDWGQFVLSCKDNINPSYLHQTTHYRLNRVVDNQQHAPKGWSFADAYQLEIGREL